MSSKSLITRISDTVLAEIGVSEQYDAMKRVKFAGALRKGIWILNDAVQTGDITPCAHCHGHGYDIIRSSQLSPSADVTIDMREPCSVCNGLGWITSAGARLMSHFAIGSRADRRPDTLVTAPKARIVTPEGRAFVGKVPSSTDEGFSVVCPEPITPGTVVELQFIEGDHSIHTTRVLSSRIGLRPGDSPCGPFYLILRPENGID